MPLIGRILALVAISFTPVACYAAQNGAWMSDGPLAWSVAQPDVPSQQGVRIGIMFSVSDQCDLGALIVPEHRYGAPVALDVDLKMTRFESVARTEEGYVARLWSAQVAALKHGENAAIITDQSILTMTLKGSAAALNAAWKSCEALIGSTPSLPPGIGRHTPRQPAPSSGPSFARSYGNVAAVQNVVFVFRKIDNNDYNAFANLVEDMKERGTALRSVIFFDNKGGSLGAAMQMGALIREMNANTAASEICASACIYAFAGGRQRTSYANTRFGLHQSRLADGAPGTLADGQRIAAQRFIFLERMGVNPKLAIWESQVESDGMRWISQYEAKGLNLVTQIIEGHDLHPPAEFR